MCTTILRKIYYQIRKELFNLFYLQYLEIDWSEKKYKGTFNLRFSLQTLGKATGKQTLTPKVLLTFCSPLPTFQTHYLIQTHYSVILMALII